MADIPLPRYNLPPAQLPGGLDVAAAVPPNPLAGIGPGINQGATLGFEARQTAALEQERQTQLMQAQAAAQQAKRENDLKALDALGIQYERLAKVHPDAAFDLYQNKMAPFMSSVLADHGMQADFQTDANPSHETADAVKRIHDAVTGLADGSIQMPEFQKIMSGIQSENNIGDYAQKRIDEGQKAGAAVGDYQKQQSDLFQNAKGEFDKQLSNRSGGLGLQDAKVNQAAHLRAMINQNSTTDSKGRVTYHFPQNIQGELVLGLANLVSGSNMANVEQMQSLTPKTARGDYAKTASYWLNRPFDATPQAFAQQLVDQIDRQGQTAQQQRDTYQQQFHSSVDPRLNDQYKQELANTTRGIRFEDYKNQGKSISRRGKADGHVYTYTLNPKTGKYE